MIDEASAPSPITLADLPDSSDKQALVELANTYQAYQIHGSFNAAVEAANRSTRRTLDELRTELFIAYRAGNHLGDDTLVRKYKELEPHFRRVLAEQS